MDLSFIAYDIIFRRVRTFNIPLLYSTELSFITGGNLTNTVESIREKFLREKYPGYLRHARVFRHYERFPRTNEKLHEPAGIEKTYCQKSSCVAHHFGMNDLY